MTQQYKTSNNKQWSPSFNCAKNAMLLSIHCLAKCVQGLQAASDCYCITNCSNKPWCKNRLVSVNKKKCIYTNQSGPFQRHGCPCLAIKVAHAVEEQQWTHATAHQGNICLLMLLAVVSRHVNAILPQSNQQISYYIRNNNGQYRSIVKYAEDFSLP